MYDRTLEHIKQIVLWLESTDENGWLDQIDEAEEALSEVRSMSEPERRPDKGPIQYFPGDSKMQKALPYVQAMVGAMRMKDRRRALESGRSALKEFSTP